MPNYKKKPVVVEAFQIPPIGEEPSQEMIDFLHDYFCRDQWEQGNDGEILIHTMEGDMIGTYGDYIIKGVVGELYPCKEDVFLKSYDPI
jgi:hypothetical protein